ncbi:hypothetical protein D3C79_1113550 [compost metagenome]
MMSLDSYIQRLSPFSSMRRQGTLILPPPASSAARWASSFFASCRAIGRFSRCMARRVFTQKGQALNW